jgi:hypothetical protein
MMAEEDVTLADMLEGPSLLQMLEELPPLSNGLRMRTLHAKYKAQEQQICILTIKMWYKYSFIEMNKFPRQDFDGTSYVFKMSSNRPESGVELVRRMTEGDLKHVFVHFDHIKHVHHWTMLGAHVYDPYYRRLLMIAVCNMKIETGEAQQMFWKYLNATVLHFGKFRPKFASMLCAYPPGLWHRNASHCEPLLLF